MPERPDPEISESLAEPVCRARLGSADALAALYAAYADQVLGTAYRILGNRADAEDTLQDLFVGMPEALTHYREEDRRGAWLRGSWAARSSTSPLGSAAPSPESQNASSEENRDADEHL